MKRKTIFILLVLVMCMALVPAAAYAQVWSGNTYGFHIAETEITKDNYADVFGDGTVTYDPDTKTLTLNNYHYSGPGYLFSGIYCGMIIGQTSTIELIGDNSITLDAPESGKQSVGLKYDGSDSIYFKGSGSLSIKAGDTTNANNYGITAYYGDLVFANDFSGSLTAVGGDLLTYGTTYGIYCSDIYIYSGTVTGIGGNHSGSYDSESAITSSGIYGGAHRVYGGTLTGIGGDISNTNGRGGYSYGIDGSNSSYSEIYIFDGTVIARGGNVYSSADNNGGAYSFGLQKYDASHPYSGGTTFTPGLIVYGGTLIAQGGNVSKASATDEVNWTRTQTYGLTGGTVIVDGGTVIAKAGLNNGSFKIGHHDYYTYGFLRSGFNAKLKLGASKIAGAVGYSNIDGNGFGPFTAVDLDQNYNLHGVVGGESEYPFTINGRNSSYNIPATGIVIVPSDYTAADDLGSISGNSYLVRTNGDAVEAPTNLDLGENSLIVADLYEGSDHPADRSGLSFAGGSITGDGGKLVAVGPTQVYYDETYSKGIYSSGDLTVSGDVDVVAFGGTANRSTGAEISGTLDVSGLTDTGSFVSNGHNDGLAAAAVNTGSHCSKDLGVHFFAASRLSEDPVYTVTIDLGEHMSLAEGSGALSQSESGKLADIVVRADEGYYFPQDYLDQISKKVSKSLELTRAVKGQSASGLFVTEITISGIPSDNINIELPDTTEYLFPLWIGGVRVTGSNMGDITAAINKAAGSEVAAGSARMTLKLGSYYSGYETPRIYELDLSLTDFNYTGPGYGFETGKYAAFYLSTDYTYPYWGTFSGLVIDINGSNSITQHVSSSEPNTDECYGMYLFQYEGSVGIKGSGSLVSTADIADSKALVAGIFRRRQLDIQNTVDVKFTAPSGNASASYGMVSDGSSPLNVASAAKIEISGDTAAVYSKSGDSTISYTAPSYLAVSANIDGSSASAYTGAVPAAVSSLTAYKNIQLAKADLFVAGVPIGAVNGGDVPAAVNAAYPDSITGSITYDAENSKLTLNGASVNNLSIGTDDNNFFGIVSYLNTPLNIELIGENSITGRDRADDSYAIYASSIINFTGSGKLTATGGNVSSSDYSYGIYADISVDGPEIEAYGGSSRYYTAGISGDVTLKSGSIKALGGVSTEYYSYGIYGGVTQDGGKLTATGGKSYYNSYGIYDGLVLNGGEAYAYGGESTSDYSYGIYGGAAVNGGSLTAEGGKAYENSYGLGSGITVNGGTAVINAGDSTNYSSYGSNGTVNVNDGSLIINTGTAAYSCGVYATVNVNG